MQVSSASTQQSVSNWQSAMEDTSAPGQGCFRTTFPSTTWESVACETNATLPVTFIPLVGNGAIGNDEIAYIAGLAIGDTSAEFLSMIGFSKEIDNLHGSNYFSLQINTNTFTCNTTDTGGISADCWEQFVYQNNPGSNQGMYYIEYALIGYYTTNGKCPSSYPAGGSTWQNIGGTCYANTQIQATSLQQASNLTNLGLGGESDLSNSGQDSVIFCVSSTCYQYNEVDTVLDLYNSNWTHSEWNVFGIGGQSEANFNTGVTLTPIENIYNPSNVKQNPSCQTIAGYTGETNNLWLGTCTVSGKQMSWTESD